MKRNVYIGIITLVLVPFLLLQHQNCAQSNSSFQFNPESQILATDDNSQFLPSVSALPPAKIDTGKELKINLSFKNIGNTTWTQKRNYKLHIIQPSEWNVVEYTVMPKESVAPGEVVDFVLTAKPAEAPGPGSCKTIKFLARMSVMPIQPDDLTCPKTVKPSTAFNVTLKKGTAATDLVVLSLPQSPFSLTSGNKVVPLPRPATVALTSPTAQGNYQLRFFQAAGPKLISTCDILVTDSVASPASTSPTASPSPSPSATPEFFGDFGDQASVASIQVCTPQNATPTPTPSATSTPAPTPTPTPEPTPDPGQPGCQDQAGACAAAGYYVGYVGGTCPDFGKNEPCPKNRGATDTDGNGECGCHEECSGPPSQGGVCHGP